MAAATVLVDRSGSQVRSDSLAPHCARVMIAGAAAAALGTTEATCTVRATPDQRAGAMAVSGSLPGSMSTAFKPVTVPCSASAQIWIPVESRATMGSVAPRAAERCDSWLAASGAASDALTASHEVHVPDWRTRYRMTTPSTPWVIAHVTPTTENGAVAISAVRTSGSGT